MWTSAARAQLARDPPAYATDLTDAEWALVAPVLPAPAGTGRPRRWPLRRIPDAILHVLRRPPALRTSPFEPRGPEIVRKAHVIRTEPLSGGGFGRPRAPGMRTLTGTVPILGRMSRQPVGIRGISAKPSFASVEATTAFRRPRGPRRASAGPCD